MLPFALLALIFAPNLIIRFLGLDFWLGSRPAQLTMNVSSGMMYTLCYGLYFMPMRSEGAGRGHWHTMLLAIALVIGITVRYFSVPLLGRIGLAADPRAALAAVFGVLKWIMAFTAASAAWCAALRDDAASGHEQPPRSNSQLIASVIGMFTVFSVLIMLLEARPFFLLSGVTNGYQYFFPAVAAGVLLMAFYARRLAFLRSIVIGIAVLMIVMSCLSLFHDYPLFVIGLNTFVSIAHYIMMAVFPALIIEHYRGRYWFYLFAISIHAAQSFSTIGPALNLRIPIRLEVSILMSTVAAALFMVLSIRFLFNKTLLLKRNDAESPRTPTIADIFKQRGLSERETEIASLIVEKGMSNKDIAERIFLAEGTVDVYISKIYRKFHVKGRTEFMAMFIRG
jgi:DNA-binding CsgD family transcriptional regulator